MASSELRPDWISKSLAGVLLGAALALGASAIFAKLASGIPTPLRSQIGMWLTAPVWMSTASSVYFFASGRRAWLWLGAANVIVWGGFLLLRKA